jgi:radical SAM superfamily enzyme YgiQ (UPF0313 family)
MRTLLIALGGHNVFAYGPRIISSYIKAKGHDIDLLFVPFVPLEKRKTFHPHKKFFDENLVKQIITPINPLVREKEYGLIGVSFTTNFFDHARMITQQIKSEFDVPVIWGGIHPTVSPEECLDYADMVCKGEGEEVVLELYERISNNQPWEDIANLVFKKDGKIIRNPLRPLVQDLDRYPAQDFDISTHYLCHQFEVLKMTNELLCEFLPHGYGPGSYGYNTMATRGCPYGCTYCFNSTLRDTYAGKGKLLRRRSIESVIQELADIKERFPKVSYMLFSDETFLLGKDVSWMADFAKMYKEKVGIPFSACVSPENVSYDGLKHLIDAGLFNLQMGIQTGSRRTLKEVYDRRDNIDKLLEATKVINQFPEIMPLYDVILDNPYETAEDFKETIRLLTKIPKPFELQLFTLTWYPGAKLTERAMRDGLVKSVREEVHRKHYQAYKKSNYYNLLISMTPFFPPDLILDLMEKNDFFHRWGLRILLKLWQSTRYFSGTAPYQYIKKILVERFHVPAPVYAKIPTSDNIK